jgi:hypothetical protein
MCTHVCVQACVCACMYVYACVYTYFFVVPMCIEGSMHVCIFVCMYVYDITSAGKVLYLISCWIYACAHVYVCFVCTCMLMYMLIPCHLGWRPCALKRNKTKICRSFVYICSSECTHVFMRMYTYMFMCVLQVCAPAPRIKQSTIMHITTSPINKHTQTHIHTIKLHLRNPKTSRATQ